MDTGDVDDHRLQMLVLERRDPSRNMAGFYVLAIEPTLFGDMALVREWGRVGSLGRVVASIFIQRDLGGEALDVWLARKARRGYQVRASPFAILIGADRQNGNLSRLYRAQRPGGHPSSTLTPACPTWVSFGVIGGALTIPGQREPVKADGRSGLQGRRGRTPRLSDEEVVVGRGCVFGARGPDGMALVF